MGGRNLSSDTKLTLVHLPLASGGTDPDSIAVDMSGFDGVMFTGILGTAGSTDVCTFALETGATTDSTAFSAVSGATISSSAGEDDKLFVIDAYRPQKRYARVALTRSAAVEYGGTIAEQYLPINKPTTHDSTSLVGSVVLSVKQTT